jgi:hypothetical protein
MNAKQACELLAPGVFSYELRCKDGELLSECVDQWLVSGRYLLGTIIAPLHPIWEMCRRCGMTLSR